MMTNLTIRLSVSCLVYTDIVRIQCHHHQGYGGYGQAGYQYPTGGIEYPKPPGARDPKPPGTDY